MTTICSICKREYEEPIPCETENPNHVCMPCWYASKIKKAEHEADLATKELHRQYAEIAKQNKAIKELCCLVDDFICAVTDGLGPSQEYSRRVHKIKEAFDELGWCDNCRQMFCCGSCYEDNER